MMNKKFDFKDITLVPETISSINSRSQINIFTEDNKLPIFVSPMDTVVDDMNYNLFLDEKKCKNKDFRVLVAGHSGYHSINQINRLVSDVLYLQPEYVIFFDGINDFIHSHHNQNWEINVFV